MKQPGAYVLLVDPNRTRRRLIATAFRAAGCHVVETGKEHEVTKTLATKAKPWVLAVAGAALTQTFRDGHPEVPIVQIGSRHREAIAGRITIDTNPDLGGRVHALVATPSGADAW